MRNFSVQAITIFTVILISGFASAQVLWGPDQLIGHFDEGLSSVGSGFSNFDCLYGSNSDVFVAFCEHTTSASGDKFIIRKSFNNGETWTYQNSATGNVNGLVSPGLCTIPGTSLILTCIITRFPSGQHVIDTYRFNYSDLTNSGYSQADFSYSGAGNPEYCFALSNDAAGEVWIFTVDDNNWLFLTRTVDGLSWTPSVPVAANVTRPSGAVAADGHVAVAWVQETTGKVYCTTADVGALFQPAVEVTQNASTDASPVAGWEHIGDENLGILWHSDSGYSWMNTSADQGVSWSSDQQIAQGIYPYMNNFTGTRRMGTCYTTSDGHVMVANSATLSAIPASEFTQRNGNDAYMAGPARTAFGESSGKLAVFYTSPGLNDLWFNSSVFQGINEGSQTSQPLSVTAGPNPAGEAFSVKASGFTGTVHFTVFSLDGRIQLEENSESGEIVFDSGSLPRGTYSVVAENQGSMASCMVVRF